MAQAVQRLKMQRGEGDADLLIGLWLARINSSAVT
jgi:hypothetical protein